MEDESSTESRRRLLATAALTATASIAGCSSLVGGGGVGNSGATDVGIYSLASTVQTVSLTITDAEAEQPHTSKTVELAPGDVIEPVNDSKHPTTTSGYIIDVGVDDGPSETFEWIDPTVTLAPLWVRIDDSDNIRFLLQAG
jgi:hypothetical protein